MSNKLRDVLQDDESRSHLTNDPGDLRPEPTVIDNTTFRTCRRERLTGETGSNDIHTATPRAAIKGGHIIPDRSVIQLRAFHPRHKNCRCVGVPLNVSHGAYPCHGSEGKLKASVPGTQMDGGK
jgi:hypothetical protein